MHKETRMLTAKDLSIGYSQKTIASNINIELASGKLTAVIGVNGSGKSTLLKSLSGELPLKKGTVNLLEKPLNSYSQKSISEHISIVLSNPVFSSNLSVYELIALGRHPYTNWLGVLNETDHQAVDQAMRQVEIEDLAERNCSHLSDGQLQKVFIARALAQNTEIILLDEPTNHLDLYHKAFVFRLLKRLTRETDKSILFATHELNLALQLCDSLILVTNSEIYQAAPKELIQSDKLQNLFPADLIRFDADSVSFKIQHED